MAAPTGRTTSIVVPCFNEAHRFDETPFVRLVQRPDLRLLMVNDGSSDRTGDLLVQLADKSESITVLDLPENGGKGEAVRRGLLQTMDEGASIVGYYDSDGATPPVQLLRLVDTLLDDPRLSAAFGSRVSLLGSDIRRSAVRHYAGRAYATLASLALGMDVYDTQCGAKVFCSGPALAKALEKPFPSRWAFDVWLIDRLVSGSDGVPPLSKESFVEVPLSSWRDVGGSKMRPIEGLTAVAEISRLLTRRLAKRHRGL